MPDPIGGIQPFAELARGGETVVYKGYDKAGERFVLLKTVQLGGDPERAARFEEEASLAARVRHPNVVAVETAGQDGAVAYLVAEFVEGLDLGALLRRGPLPPALAAYVLVEAASGLAAVHKAGVLHRDLKPANLLLSEQGTVKLTDFGLASLAPTGLDTSREVRGTLAYLAPEVVRGEAPSRTSDVFSLGAVLVEMLTGRAPFARDTDGATLDAVLHHAPDLDADPRFPPAFAAFAADLLAKDPAERPATAEAVIEALDPIRAQHPAEADDLASFIRAPDEYEPPATMPRQTPTEAEDARADGAEPAAAASLMARGRWRWAAGAFAVIAVAAMGVWLTTERASESRLSAPREPFAATRTVEPDGTPVSDLQEENQAQEEDQAMGTVPVSPPPADVDPQSSEVVPELPVSAEPIETVEAAGPNTPFVPAPPDSATVSAEEEASSESPAQPGTLVIAAEPWARVRVNGEGIGTTPLDAIRMAPGIHVVTFENPDFPLFTTEVEVESGAEERVAVSLWSLVGRVAVEVSPWAEVAVDGTYWDTIPPQERPLILAPGDHRLTFTHPALGSREVTLRIAAGEARTVRVNLNEPP